MHNQHRKEHIKMPSVEYQCIGCSKEDCTTNHSPAKCDVDKATVTCIRCGLLIRYPAGIARVKIPVLCTRCERQTGRNIRREHEII